MRVMIYPAPPLPPYYSKDFFTLIAAARNSGIDETTMETKQWYNFLLERDVTHVCEPDQPPQLRPCRAEVASPTTDWGEVWARVRLAALSSDATSFAWRLVHGLLPSEGRLAEILPNNSPACRHSCAGDPAADLEHIFFFCRLTSEVGAWLLNLVRQYDPLLTPTQILRLEIEGGDGLVWVVINTMYFCWKRRSDRKKANLVECLANLTADLNILADTRYQGIACQ